MSNKSFVFCILIAFLGILSSCGQDNEITISVESIALDKDMLFIEEGEEVQLALTIIPVNATDQRITWSSEDKSIATVDPAGKLSALKAGKTTIKAVAKDGNSTTSCAVYVAKKRPSSSSASSKRTVLAYVVADNSLSAFAKADLEEMKQGMASVFSNSIHLLVYIDMGGEAKLVEIVNEDGNVAEEIIKTYPDRNSTGITETLEVFDDVFTNDQYTAESYGLIYWSHCDGWIPYPVPSTRWIGQDTGHGDNRMNLADFVQILDLAPHFDFIMFDACFMQSVEVAYALRNHTDYYIASPTEIPGPGAPYDKVVPYMFVDENAAVDMAKAYFDTYASMYNGGINISNDNWTGGTSIAVLKTSGLENLASVTKQLLSGGVVADNAVLREKVFNYDKRSSSAVGYYDMQQMMELILDNSAYSYWKQAFDASIAYWDTTEKNYSQFYNMFSMKGTNGITHYIPRSTTSAASVAYQSTDWYSAAGLDKIGW